MIIFDCNHVCRSDYIKNEVACDYNAGFQSAVAGLRDLAAHGLLPDAA